MADEAEAISQALGKIQSLLDRMTQRGQHDAAFQIARAQFSASMRASWPGNLAAVAKAIDKALAEAGDALDEMDRIELREAAAVLRTVQHP